MSHLVYITLFGEMDGVTLSRLDCRHLPLEDSCVKVKQLQPEDMIKVRQLPMNKCYSRELDNS